MSEVIDIRRRRFLQGSAATAAVLGAGVTTSLLGDESSVDEKTRKTEEIKNAKHIPTMCEMCVNACAVVARVVDGKIMKLDPNPLFTKSRSFACARGNAAIAAAYDPDRLKGPMIRLEGTKRGDGLYKQVTWDEAFEYIRKKTVKILDEEKDNRSAIAFGMGAGMGEPTFHHFSTAFGSANIVDHYTTCFAPAFIANKMTYGSWGSADFENSEYVIMMGANRAEAIVTPDSLDLFKRTHGRGAKIVYIDVRYTNTAAQSDEFYAIKPGTDLALILAMLYHSISNKLYNKEYIDKYTEGFEKLEKEVLANKYTPEWASKITEIPADDIKRITEEFAEVALKTGGAANMYRSRKSTWYFQDFQLRRAQAVFNAIHGCINTKGGVLLGKGIKLQSESHTIPIYENAMPRLDVHFYQDHMPLLNAGKGSWQVMREKALEINKKYEKGGEAALGRGEYRLRGMMVYRENPIQSVPDLKKTVELFNTMDLIVMVDILPNDTAVYADVILPEATYLEREDPVKSFGSLSEAALGQRNPVIAPMYDTKPVRDIVYGLSKALEEDLYKITEKYTAPEDREELHKIHHDYKISHVFEKTIHENNVHAVEKYPKAAEILKTYGIYYPGIEENIKKIDSHTLTFKPEYKGKNELTYYPEEKKVHTVKLKEKIKLALEELDERECKHPFTGKLESVGSVPVWKDSWYQEVPEGKFRMIIGRHGYFTQSSHPNNYMLLDLVNYNYIWINNEVADEMGLKAEDEVEVISKVGKVTGKVMPTMKIRKDCMFYATGFGSKSRMFTLGHENGISQAEILTDDYDPVIGASSMNETMVEIRKV